MKEQAMKFTTMRRISVLALPVMLAAPASLAAGPQERAAQETKEAATSTGNAVKDSWLTMKVHSLFVPEDALEGSDIDVDTKAGVVTLTGTVVSDAAKARAVAVAKGADGVKSVNDQLRVVPLAAAGETAREAGRTAAGEAREAGRTAAGEAREAGRTAAGEAREAGRAARDTTKETAGTTGKAVTDGWIKSKIAAQFVTEEALDNSDIDIDISKGAVTLTGAVRTPAARTRAQAIATGTDGVRSVKNNLKVDPGVK
jgi:hyperosmotically inducible protein